ncbi:uncharacterized protein isoform X2 [Danio rerio]|uniref:Uncharacterized protein isoform X2 n=1 Tax=Danio rerio TaxID=7955 RepID=A0AC58GA03_DANRE
MNRSMNRLSQFISTTDSFTKITHSSRRNHWTDVNATSAVSHADGPGQRKHGRGSPRKSESKAGSVVEVKKEEQPEEEEDDVVDAGALDDQGDSDYKPADEEARSRLAVRDFTPPPSCSSSSPASTSRKHPSRIVGPPRKFLPDSESPAAPSETNNIEDPRASEEASSFGLENRSFSFSNGTVV